MMKSVLKTLALSFGGGLALGAGIRLTQGSPRARKEPGVDLNPLLQRLRSVENRIVDMEATRVEHVAPAAAAASATDAETRAAFETLAGFEARLAAQFADVEQLRGEIRHVDHRLSDFDSQIPAIIQSTVDLRFREVEKKLQQDFEEAQTRSMDAFVATLQNKVVERISTLETNLAEQSDAIGKLRDASLRTDENLQKMLVGIERLVDQTRGFSPPPATTASGRSQPEPPEPSKAAGSNPVIVIPRTPETSRYEKSAASLVADPVQMMADIAPDIPVLASVPEISPVTTAPPVEATAHANGAVKKESPAKEPASSEVAAAVMEAPAAEGQPAGGAETSHVEESYEWVNRIGLELLAPRPKPRNPWKIPAVIGLVAGLIGFGVFYRGALLHFFDSRTQAQATSTLASTAPSAEVAATPGDLQTLEQRAAANPRDPAALVALGKEYSRRKDWAKAEASYRSALEASPGYKDAALGLVDVLWQEQKFDESAAVLNKYKTAQ